MPSAPEDALGRMPGQLVVRVLGPVELWEGERRLPLGGRRQRAVLARLALAAGAVVPMDRLVEDVWEGGAPATARNQVQVRISELRRILGQVVGGAPEAVSHVLAYRDPGYRLQLPTDGERFEGLLAAGRQELATGDPSAAANSFDAALALWRADRAYTDLADAPWLVSEVSRLGELRLLTEELGWSAALDSGRAQEAVAALRRSVHEHPLREGLWRLLALGLYRTDRQAEALETISAARSLVGSELGLDAMPALRELELEILNHSPELAGPRSPSTVLRTPTVEAPQGTARPFVGRDAERQVVLAAAQEAAAGALRVVVVTGEPGIGKTRLVEEVASALSTQGWAVAWGRCHESGGSPPLWPWSQALAAVTGQDPAPPGRSGPGRTRFDRWHDLASDLTRRADAAPVLLAIDDLQWADAETLAVLGALPELAARARVLVVATVRSDAVDELAATWATVVRHGGRMLDLRGLSESAVRDLTAAARMDVDAAGLARRTGGNPFLIAESLRWAQLHGADAALTQIPTGVAALLRDRVARLGEPAASLLSVAAVAGTVPDPVVVAAAAGHDEDAVADAFDAAVALGVLAPGPGGVVRFPHDLVRESLYAAVPPLRRRRLHAAVLTALERLDDRDVGSLARHAAAAGPDHLDDVVRWSVAAAERATAQLAHDDAVRWWAAALDAQEKLVDHDPRAETELLVRLVGARLDAGEVISAERTRALAVQRADAVDDPLLQVRALVSLDRPGVWVLRGAGEPDLGIIGRLRRALRRDDVPAVLRCRLLATLATELSYTDGRQERLALCAEAVTAARQLDQPDVLAFALMARYLTLAPDAVVWLAEVPPLGEELLRIAIDHDRPVCAFIGHLLLAMSALTRFDPDGCERHLAAATDVDRRVRLPLAGPQVGCIAFNVALYRGRFEEAEALLDQMADLGLEWWTMPQFFATMRLFLLLRSGRPERIDQDLLDRVSTIEPAMVRDAALLVPDAPARPPSAWLPIGDSWLGTAAWWVRARAALAVGDVGMCRTAYARLLPWSGRVNVTGTVDAGPMDLLLSRLAHALGDDQAARRHRAEHAKHAVPGEL